jgi:iron complex transport system ATP-binding protein
VSRALTPILAVRDLTIRRGNVTILDRIAWTVAPGEHWIVLGANGSGKTSLLSALTGYLPPTAGDVRVLGEEFGASDWRDLRLHVGIVSSSVRQLMHDDEPALVTVASGKYATIGHWGRLPKADLAAAHKLLAQVECTAIADRPWLVLSQGERQRVLIARALMARPRLLILDEPCAGLDPVAREQFLAFVERLAAQKSASPALVLVTHHVEEIMPSFTHALLLRTGRVVTAGARGRVLTSPQLSTTFDTPLKLRRMGGRYTLRLAPSHPAKVA